MQPASSYRQEEPIFITTPLTVFPVKDRDLSIMPVIEGVRERWHFNYHKEGGWGGELLKAFANINRTIGPYI